MGKIHLEVAETLDARPETIWDILTDYREGHPAILPKAFGPLTVEEGGRGAGTIMRFSFRLGGTTRDFHQRVSEPEPGRVLQETSLDGSGQTTFTLDPVEDGRRTRLTITTDLAGHGGLQGLIERALTPRLVQPVYREEIAKLAALAAQREASKV